MQNLTDYSLNYSGINPFDLYDYSLNESDNVLDSSQNFAFYIQGLLYPTIGFFGVIGNILNLFVLYWRACSDIGDHMEKVALTGLIGLAISDLFFCTTIIPYYWIWKQKVLFHDYTLELYINLYSEYLTNVFIKTSTWLTTLIAIGRYIAICHPLQANMYLGLRFTKIAILCTFVIWFALSSPLMWCLSKNEFHDGERIYIYLDLGIFSQNKIMKTIFTVIWSLLGYLIPVGILTFCNICLIKVFRESRLSHEDADSNSQMNSGNRVINGTLISLIVMFILLISPSEILHFIFEIDAQDFNVYHKIILVTNLLQAINFAFHFILYCVVNVTFRKTLLLFISTISRQNTLNVWQRRLTRNRTMSSSCAPVTFTTSLGGHLSEHDHETAV